MKILNQHIKSLKPRGGAEWGRVPIYSHGYWFDGDYRYFRRIVCWADEARLFNCILINTGEEAATVYFKTMSSSGTNSPPRYYTEPFNLAAGEEKVLFPKKQIALKKNEYLDLYSDKTTVSLLVNCYYLSGYDWFHLRQSFTAEQVEYIEGKFKTSWLGVQAESLEKGNLLASWVAAQTEYTENTLLVSWFDAQAEYLKKALLASWMAIQAEYTGGGAFDILKDTVRVGDTFYGTIQAAVDAAVDGDVVHIYPGVYEESISINKLIHIVGEGWPPTDIKIKIADHGLVYTISDSGESPTIILDNLTVELTSGYDYALFVSSTSFPALTVEAYNCLLDCEGFSSYPLGMDYSNVTINLYNCTLLKGYGHVRDYDDGILNFYHVELNGSVVLVSSYKTLEDSDHVDYVTEPTENYGYKYKKHSYEL